MFDHVLIAAGDGASYTIPPGFALLLLGLFGGAVVLVILVFRFLFFRPVPPPPPPAAQPLPRMVVW